MNLLLLVAMLSMLQATLTLPGMAAMALTLGMAIDANVLINERIREELRNGATPQAAIHAGYDRAWATILDSNITTLIAGLALLVFGTGPVRGFAVVHCRHPDLDVLGAWFLARPDQPSSTGRRSGQPVSIGRGSGSRNGEDYRGQTKRKHADGILPHRKDILFMRHARLFNASFRCSPSLLAVFFLATRGLHLSVEFTGGTLIEVSYSQHTASSEADPRGAGRPVSGRCRCRTSAARATC